MTARRFSYEDANKTTGEDIEDLRDEQHPGENLDVDFEGSGVEEPDLDRAEWDIKIEEEDGSDPHLADIELSELSPIDREVYLALVSLRRNIREALANKSGGWDSLMKELDEFTAQLENPDDNQSRVNFYAMIKNKLTVLSLELQMAKRKSAK